MNGNCKSQRTATRPVHTILLSPKTAEFEERDVVDNSRSACSDQLSVFDAKPGFCHVIDNRLAARRRRLASRDRVLPDRKGVPADLNSQGQNR